MLNGDDLSLCYACVDGNDDLLCGVCSDDGDVDLKHALFDDPIVGRGPTLLDKHGLGALEPRELSTPPTMTPAQRAKHNLTHLPFHPGCPICMATRRPNTHHRKSHEHEKVIPLLVADY